MNPPNIEILPTKDGSTTLYLTDMEETYHSRHGAMRESMYVYLRRGVVDCLIGAGILKADDCGLHRVLEKQSSGFTVFEMGFGTGLNAWLLQEFSDRMGIDCLYIGIEKFPLVLEWVERIDFGFSEMQMHWNSVSGGLANHLFSDAVEELCRQRWEALMKQEYLRDAEKVDVRLNQALKIHGDIVSDLERIMPLETDLIFWDAFAPKKQPELWTAEIFARVKNRMRKGGLLVTYTANSQVRRNMVAAGFSVERITGPPGKKHMLRAWKD